MKLPTDWCAPILVVPKRDGRVRLCVDYSKLNESVKQENFPLPSTNQLLIELDRTTVLTKLDCKSGFHQIVLHKDSQELMTHHSVTKGYLLEEAPNQKFSPGK